MNYFIPKIASWILSIFKQSMEYFKVSNYKQYCFKSSLGHMLQNFVPIKLA